jgi:hypothetical protein
LLARVWSLGDGAHQKKGFWGWAQIISGGALGLFFLVHGSGALSARHVFNIDTNFYWPAGSLVTPSLPTFFTPYYMTAALAVFTHLAAALHYRISGKISAFAPPLLIGAGAAYGAIIIIVFSGTLFEINLPAEYQEYFSTLAADN